MISYPNPDDVKPRGDRFADERVAEGWFDLDLLNEAVKLNKDERWAEVPEIFIFRPAGL